MAVLAHQHEAQAEDHLAFAVGGDGAATDFVADLRRRPRRRPDRHAVVGGDDDVWICPILVVRPRPWTSSRLLFCADVAAADVAVVLLQGLDDVVQGQAVFDEASGSRRT